ncbi:MAG: hypothetical protein Q4G27_06630 [Flavobacteriaceae bacterium]|nr:hypothetical protein [Flavobacteriaceae bacterium]
MRIFSFFLILYFFHSCATSQGISNVLQAPSMEYTGTENDLTLRVKIILLRTDDGKGNFDLNHPEEGEVIKEGIFNSMNNFKSWVKPNDLKACYSGFDFFPSTGLDFDVKFVYVNNTYAWNYLNSGSDMKINKLSGFSPSTSWYMKQIDDSIHLSEGNKKYIHVYLTNDGEDAEKVLFQKQKPTDPKGKAAAQFPSYSDFDRSSQIHMPNAYLKYKYMREVAPAEYNEPWSEVRKWLTEAGSAGLTHELLHNLGLAHNNEFHGANQCQYSIMSQKHTHARNYLQPTEIKKVHEVLSKTNMIQFVTENSHYGKTIVLNTGGNWNELRRYYADFRLKNNQELTISNKIILPVQAKFHLERNSKVRITKDGSVVYPDGSEFNGWVRHSTANVIKE